MILMLVFATFVSQRKKQNPYHIADNFQDGYALTEINMTSQVTCSLTLLLSKSTNEFSWRGVGACSQTLRRGETQVILLSYRYYIDS